MAVAKAIDEAGIGDELKDEEDDDKDKDAKEFNVANDNMFWPAGWGNGGGTKQRNSDLGL